MRKAKTLLKERMKALRSVEHKKVEIDLSIENRIGEVENTIKCCEYDLKNSFKGNERIMRKLDCAKSELDELKKKLEDKKLNEVIIQQPEVNVLL